MTVPPPSGELTLTSGKYAAANEVFRPRAEKSLIVLETETTSSLVVM